jgi:hypothetical protein
MRANWGIRPEPDPKDGTCGKPLKRARFVGRPVEKPTDVAQGSYEQEYCPKPRGHWGEC